MNRVAVMAGLALACSCAEGVPQQAPSQGRAAEAAVKPADPGGLVGVTMNSKVGVLLDEIPASIRDRAAAEILAKPVDFWVSRAHAQLHLTFYRLVFRSDYYGNSRQQLPLPPEDLWNVTVGPRTRATINGHDLIVADYSFESTLLTTFTSPGISEQKLDTVGGYWDEPFRFPIDPELLFQRTRYACMDEAQFPPGSVDSEETDSFYDDLCKVEQHLTNTWCHQSELPTESCVEALDRKIGRVDTNLRFTRLPWSQAKADQVRRGLVTNTTGADLVPVSEEFHVNRVIYRYFAPDDCALVEKCIGAPGWRRLLQFATADQNTGNKALDIGSVDYFLKGAVNPLQEHNMFEFSACHQHYHFSHYGDFSWGASNTSKRAFCLQSTNRWANREESPLHNPYPDCDYQGVEVGWVDEYKAGLPCQWIDVTDVDTSKNTVTRPLAFTSNPDGFLCEGNPVLDASGNLQWVPTQFTTADGGQVDKPLCDYYKTPSDPQAWLSNNTESYALTLDVNGEGYVTKPCDRGQLGHLRNCGLTKSTRLQACTPGAQVNLRCTVASGGSPQVVRVCEASSKLQSGTACTFQESLASAPVDGTATVSFTCPAARDTSEPGGLIALYTGAVLPTDPTAKVTCTIQ